jgi:hypothetical protein
MHRVPGSPDSKSKEAGIDAEVKVLQKWDGLGQIIDLLLAVFMLTW